MYLFITLILKNYVMNFEDEMASNSSYSLITPGGLKLSFESISEFLLCLIISTATILTTEEY